MARFADDERLAPFFRHEGCPRVLAKGRGCEVGEPGHVVRLHLAAAPAQFAFPPQEAGDQLLAGVMALARDAVVEDHIAWVRQLSGVSRRWMG